MPERAPARTARVGACEWGDRYGYSRAVKAGDLIEVAGTTAPGDTAYEQARAHMDGPRVARLSVTKADEPVISNSVGQ